MIPKVGEPVMCPRCNKFMGKQKKYHHYWKCRKGRGGCGAILKANGTLVIKKKKDTNSQK